MPLSGNRLPTISVLAFLEFLTCRGEWRSARNKLGNRPAFVSETMFDATGSAHIWRIIECPVDVLLVPGMPICG